MALNRDQDQDVAGLAQLAAAHGVATSYENRQRRRVDVDPDVVRTVLGLLDVEADTPAAVRRELARVRERDNAGRLPPTVVVRPGQTWKILGNGNVLGEKRQPNLPGTVDQYPNWRIRLPVSLEGMCDDPRMHRVASLLGRARPRPAGSSRLNSPERRSAGRARS